MVNKKGKPKQDYRWCFKNKGSLDKDPDYKGKLKVAETRSSYPRRGKSS